MTEGTGSAAAPAVEATAPCRMDLGGGSPGDLAVAVALDRRVACRAETARGVRLESKDSLRRVEAPSARALAGDEEPIARVLGRLGIEDGVALATRTRLPPDAGLGEAVALSVAVAAAAAGLVLRDLARGEAAWLASAGTEGDPLRRVAAHAAERGGVVALAPGGEVEVLAVDPARVEECLLLVDAGETLPGGGAGGEDAGRAVGEALRAGRFDAVGELWRAEWEARVRRGGVPAGGLTARAAEALLAAGAGVRPADGGRGRVLAAWAPPGRRGPGPREGVLRAAREAGLRVFPARVDLRGLEVERGGGDLR